jgi:hypothetical protein
MGASVITRCPDNDKSEHTEENVRRQLPGCRNREYRSVDRPSLGADDSASELGGGEGTRAVWEPATISDSTTQDTNNSKVR